MNPNVRAHRLIVAFWLIAFLAASCGDGDATGLPSSGGTTASGGDTTTGGGTTARGGTTGGGGETAGGEGGAGESGRSGADCTGDDDCVPLSDCYSAACRDGMCVGSPLPRGSACGGGFCNGFARCLPCLDDASGTEEDTGCSRDAPLCDELSSEPACVGCLGVSDCNDGVECTTDRCTDATCENVPRPMGSSCSDGFCDGEADEDSCAPCVDDGSTGVDMGCTLDLPHCYARRTPRTCIGCQSSLDCYDDNECTSDRCLEGVCERATFLSGTPCSLGYCNGIPGAEVCVPKPCQTSPDCDDLVACTAEVCAADHCVYTTHDETCPDSGDVCKPNVCTVGTGCRQIDVTRALELLSNGTLDLGNTDWVETSQTYDQVIYPYDYIPTLFPHTPVYVAWLGNGEGRLDESNSLSQTVAVPAGAVRFELSFFYQIWADDLPDDRNHMQVKLRSTGSSPSDLDILTLHNQDETRVWTGVTATIDATEWAESDAILEFSGTSIDGYTAFFVDSISLVATVCD